MAEVPNQKKQVGWVAKPREPKAAKGMGWWLESCLCTDLVHGAD